LKRVFPLAAFTPEETKEDILMDISELTGLPRLFSLPQVVKMTGYNDQYLRELCRERRISFILRRGRYFFTAEDIKGILAGERMEKTEIEKGKIKGKKTSNGGK
jgi:hypothetical protein